MKVCVDQTKCRSAGNCVKICPEVFRFQTGNKKALALMTNVPLHLEDKVTEAASKCPECAIVIS